MNRFVLTLILASALLSGCGVLQKEPYRKVYYYDVGVPSIKENSAVITELKLLSGAYLDDKMLFRISGNEMEYDEFNRWVAVPGDMLKAYLRQALLSDEGTKNGKYLLHAELFRFELSLPERSAECCVAFSLSDVNGKTVWRKQYQEKVQAKELKAAAFADAMQTAVSTLVQRLAADLKEVK